MNIFKNGFTIIIVNYFCEDYIENLITQIINTIKSPYEFIIINNAKPKFSYTKKQQDKLNIKMIENSGNQGFGIAMNLGVKNSNYEYVYLVNPDMKITGTTLDDIYNDFLTEDKNIGSVSCKILNTDFTIQNGYFLNKTLKKLPFFKHQMKLISPKFLKKFFKEKEISKTKYSDNKYEVAGFYASFVLIKKEVFNSINGFDPDYFMYSEDIDLFRTRYPREYKCLYYDKYEVIHHSGKTDKYNLMDKQAQVSFLLYLRKNGLYFLFIYLFLHSPRYLLVFIVSIFLNKQKSKKASLDFFSSLKYLPEILKAKNYGSLQSCLKINEIPD